MPDDEGTETEVEEEESYDGPEGMLASSSEKMHPNRQEDEQDMEMEPVVMSPPGYGSPDPVTGTGILVPLEESPLEIADDYGSNVAVESEVGEASEGEESETENAEGRPAPSATRAEWDEFARSQGVDPEQFSSKEDLIAALS